MDQTALLQGVPLFSQSDTTIQLCMGYLGRIPGPKQESLNKLGRLNISVPLPDKIYG